MKIPRLSRLTSSHPIALLSQPPPFEGREPTFLSFFPRRTDERVCRYDGWNIDMMKFFWGEEGRVAKIFAKLNIIKHGDGSNGFSLRRSLSFLPQWVESPGEWIDASFFKISCYGNNVEREKKKKLCSFCFLFVFFFPIRSQEKERYLLFCENNYSRDTFRIARISFIVIFHSPLDILLYCLFRIMESYSHHTELNVLRFE